MLQVKGVQECLVQPSARSGAGVRHGAISWSCSSMATYATDSTTITVPSLYESPEAWLLAAKRCVELRKEADGAPEIVRLFDVHLIGDLHRLLTQRINLLRGGQLQRVQFTNCTGFSQAHYSLQAEAAAEVWRERRG